MRVSETQHCSHGRVCTQSQARRWETNIPQSEASDTIDLVHVSLTASAPICAHLTHAFDSKRAGFLLPYLLLGPQQHNSSLCTENAFKDSFPFH